MALLHFLNLDPIQVVTIVIVFLIAVGMVIKDYFFWKGGGRN